MLHEQFLFEYKYCNPRHAKKMRLISSLRSRIKPNFNPFLNDEFGTNYTQDIHIQQSFQPFWHILVVLK